MKQFQYTITDPVGIHARPAGALAKAAKDFDSVVLVEFNGKTADINKLMSLMALGIRCNDTITVTVAGLDEETAVVAMEKYFKEYL